MSVAAGCKDGTGPGPVVGYVSVAGSAAEIQAGGAVQLVATVVNTSGALMANPSVAWSSSDEGVARVSPVGMVTGVGPGQAEVADCSVPVGTLGGGADGDGGDH